MKSSRFLLAPIFLLVLILSNPVYSQGLKVHNMIGKSLDGVAEFYGKPVHKDIANENMQCIFYKTNNDQFVFVADAEGVYQAEGSVGYNSRKAALDAMNDFINSCQSQDCKIDTVSQTEFHFEKPGVKADATLFENTHSEKYEVKVKANKSGS